MRPTVVSLFRQSCRWIGVTVEACTKISSAATGRSSPRTPGSTAGSSPRCARPGSTADPAVPVRPPFARNVRFYATAAAAQRAGFRACKRCRPDATPGSPEWNVRGDVVARTMRLIADGTVDREGVGGLAAHLGYTTRQLERMLQAEVGAGPLALARAQRAQTARVLIETTDSAVRRCRVRRRVFQHPAVQRHRAPGVRNHADVLAQARGGPSRVRRNPRAASPGTVCLRLPVRDAVRLRRRFRSSGRRRRTRLRGSPRRCVSTQPAAPLRQRRRRLDTRSRSRPLPAGARRLPRPHHRDRPVPAAAGSRCRPRSGDGRADPRPRSWRR